MTERVAPKRRVKRGWMSLRISKIFSDNPSTKTLYFEDAEEGGCQFDYIPGQYLTLRFDDLAEKPIVRSYTMSSSPKQKGFVAITVREVEDPFVSRSLCRDYKVGDVIRARGPIGRFCFDPKKDHSHLVMVAGGSGVTPFVSIMREHSHTLGQEGSPRRMSLFVTFRSDEELMCWEDLEELRSKEGMDVFITLSRQEKVSEKFIKGRVTPDLIHEKLEADYNSKTYMTCGPEALMQMVVRHLDSKEVDKESVKLESFD